MFIDHLFRIAKSVAEMEEKNRREIGFLLTRTSLTDSEKVPSFFLRTSEVFAVSDSIVF